MKSKTVVFLFLAVISFIFASVFAFLSRGAEPGGVMIPAALGFVLIGITNSALFYFTRDLVVHLAENKKENQPE